MARQLVSMGESMFGSYIEGSDEEVILRDCKMLEDVMHFVRTGEKIS
jgi:hypothetical protein